jgi:hypothetical protein
MPEARMAGKVKGKIVTLARENKEEKMTGQN